MYLTISTLCYFPSFLVINAKFEAKDWFHKISCIPWFCRMRWDFVRLDPHPLMGSFEPKNVDLRWKNMNFWIILVVNWSGQVEVWAPAGCLLFIFKTCKMTHFPIFYVFCEFFRIWTLQEVHIYMVFGTILKGIQA